MLNKSGLFLLLFLFNASFTYAQTTAKVTVTPANQNINPGQNVTVRISTENVDNCTITGEPYNNFNIIKSGSILLRPQKTTEYTFNCKDAAGRTVSAKSKVTIVPLANTSRSNTTGGTQAGNANTGSSNTGSNSISNILSGISGLTQSQINSTANTAPRNNTQYSNQNLLVKANELCARYSNYNSVYGDPTVGGGGGSVPVDLSNLASVLIYIQRYQQLTANELRQSNLIRYCEEYRNMARASERLADNAARTIRSLADNCYADEACLRGRVFRSGLEQEVARASRAPLYSETLTELVRTIGQPRPQTIAQRDIQMRRYCDDYYQNKNFVPKECWMVPRAFETIVTSYDQARNNIQERVQDLNFNSDGVMGARPCIRTASNRPPEEVKFYEADCLEYRQEPSIVNQEALRQITALPYTQAFSPSAVLGFDGVLDNINTRTREGNLIDSSIAPNLGSNSGGVGGGTVDNGIDLKALENNYKQITANIGVITQLYDAATLAYASSTSLCKVLPVTTRNEAVRRITENKKTYTDYLADLKTKWENAIAKPRENHTDLIIKVNFDLKDKYNQAEIDRVLKAVKELLQVCVDAGGKVN